jgi:hypothetical protein
MPLSPDEPKAQGGGQGVRYAFYILLRALPFSGWNELRAGVPKRMG